MKNWKEKEKRADFSISLPQILIGASSSRRFGWLRKTPLEAKQSCLISASVKWTCFVVLPFFASTNRRIMSSSKLSSIITNPSKKQTLTKAATKTTLPRYKDFFAFLKVTKEIAALKLTAGYVRFW